MAMAGLSSTGQELIHLEISTPTTAAGRKARTMPKREAPRLGRGGQADQRLPEGLKIDRHHRQDRAQLDDDGEGFPMSPRPSSRSATRRCAVEETGRNSVRPSTMPSHDRNQNVVHAEIP